MDVFPLIVRPCTWRLEDLLRTRQARPLGSNALSQKSASEVDLALSNFAYELARMIGMPDPAVSTSEWAGIYNNQYEIRLRIAAIDATEFRGTIEYPDDGTVTSVEGKFDDVLAEDDALWISRGDIHLKPQIAVSLKEVGYLKRNRSIDFNGEYRAVIAGNEMLGAWFSGTRRVGGFRLQRQNPTP
jgi:hypothetical protein